MYRNLVSLSLVSQFFLIFLASNVFAQLDPFTQDEYRSILSLFSQETSVPDVERDVENFPRQSDLVFSRYFVWSSPSVLNRGGSSQ